MIIADDLAKLARELGGPMANEVRIRGSVSRAYYAAYHYCDQAANSWCDPLPAAAKEEKRSHEQLYHRLENCSKNKTIEKDLKLMAAEAKNLRNLRVRADYYLSDNFDQKSVIRSLSYMSQVKSYLDLIINATNAVAATEIVATNKSEL